MKRLLLLLGVLFVCHLPVYPEVGKKPPAPSYLTAAQESRVQTLYQRAQAFQANRPLKAKRLLLRAVRIYPHHAPSLYLLGRLEERAGHFKLAVAYFRRAYSQAPYERDVVYWMGIMALRRGDSKAALRYFSETLDLDQSYTPAYFYRGTVYFRLGDIQKCSSDTLRAVELDSAFRPLALKWYNEKKEQGLDQAEAIERLLIEP